MKPAESLGFTDPELIYLTTNAKKVLTDLNLERRDKLIPCLFFFRNMADVENNEMTVVRTHGIELGWYEPQDIPSSVRGTIEKQECAYLLGNIPNDTLITIDHDGVNFVKV